MERVNWKGYMIVNLVDIVIVNWNTGDLLKNCLDSIIECKDKNIGSVIVVDNASSDDSLSKITTDIDYLKIVKEKTNHGFGKACNIGAKLCLSEYILFLNPDTEINESSIRVAVEYMEKDSSSNIGICGIQLIDHHGITASCSRFPSPSRIFFNSIGLTKVIPRLGSPMRDFSHDYIKEVDQVMGAFFLIRSKLFNLCKGFDERFFVYYEEVDLSKRITQFGYISMFLPKSNAFHLGGGASRNVKASRLFYSLRSKYLYAAKHFTYGGRFIVLLSMFILEPISRIFFNILKINFKGILETSHAYLMLISWFIRK